MLCAKKKDNRFESEHIGTHTSESTCESASKIIIKRLSLIHLNDVFNVGFYGL